MLKKKYITIFGKPELEKVLGEPTWDENVV